jgi:hypothetical protein
MVPGGLFTWTEPAEREADQSWLETSSGYPQIIMASSVSARLGLAGLEARYSV